MKKFLIIISCLFSLTLLTSKVQAGVTYCEDIGIVSDLGEYPYDANRQSLTVNVTGLEPGSYELQLFRNQLQSTQLSTSSDTAAFVIPFKDAGWMDNTRTARKTFFLIKKINGKYENICKFKAEAVVQPGENNCDITFWQDGKKDLACYTNNTPIAVSASNILFKGQVPEKIIVRVKDGKMKTENDFIAAFSLSSGSFGQTPGKVLGLGDNRILIKNNDAGGMQLCERTIPIQDKCDPEDQVEGTGASEDVPIDLCERLSVSGSDATAKCNDCLNNNGVWTALGCISTDPQAFIKDFLSIAMGIAGGIALLLMIYGAFLVSVSAGDPKKAEEGKEIITGTIAGLLFIIFSVVLLKLIGVDILQIPGLS